MNPQMLTHYAAIAAIAIGGFGFLAANWGTISAGFGSVMPKFSTAPPVVDDDTADFQALRRLQKRAAAKPEVIAALKIVAASFIEG